MNSDSDGVQDIIRQLKGLQLKQTELLARLELARSKEQEERTVTVVNNKVTSNVNETRPLAIGDKVRIINPSPFQVNKGVVIKIGTSRVTVLTESGTKILRAAKNLVIIEQHE